MGYGILLDANEVGCCENECIHKDCAYWKDFIKNATCKMCNEKIEVGQGYYGTKPDELKHTKCVWAEAE